MGLVGRLGSVLLLVALVAGAVTPLRSYRRLKMFELATLADVVVSGEISDVDSDTFDFTVDRVIVGEPAARSLCVRKFKNWTCHRRWTDYADGQRLLLFLHGDPSGRSVLNVLGGGDEGEMPFVADQVITHDAHDYRVRGIPVAEHQPAGARMSGSMMPFAELAEAIRGFRMAFSWELADGWGIATIAPRSTLAALEDFARSSNMAAHLSEEARSSPQWAGPAGDEPTWIESSALRRISARAHGLSGPARLAPGRAPDEFGFELDPSFGAAVAWLGDVDGDGVRDLATGAPRDSFLGHFHGAVWILFLTERGEVKAKTELREQLAGFPASMNEFAALGDSLAPLGDLDGDGVPDLAVAAPGWKGPKQKGGVWVLFLKADGSIARAVELGQQEPLRAAGVGAESGIGASLATLGDLDGDGSVELAIGQNPDIDAEIKSGRSVLIASLARDGTVRRVRRIHDRDDGFASGYSWLGSAISAIGDVDADGVADLAVADTHDPDGGNLRGAVWIVFLTREGAIKGKQKLSDWTGGFDGRLVDESMFGRALGGPGDLDGDGIPDLLVGSAEGIWTLLLRRDGTVRSHRLADLADGENGAPAALGRSIACAPPAPGSARGPIAAGGWFGEAAARDTVVWWLQAGKGGALEAW